MTSTMNQVIGGVIAIGNFDGVHLGHQVLLKKAIELARQLDTQSIAYTFWPHPSKVVGKGVRLIYTRGQRRRLIEGCGIDALVEEQFDQAFSRIEASDFVKDILLKKMQATAVVIGENYRFGHGAKGDVKLLADILGSRLIIVPPVLVDGQVCSSTRIRESIASGDVENAAKMLGRLFSLEGEVIRGAGRGSTIGYPTANIKTDQELWPANGVYSTLVDSKPAATNIGTRPTFGGTNEVHIETHIPGFAGNLYGKRIEVRFVKKIRDEMKFDSIDALKSQIAQDVMLLE